MGPVVRRHARPGHFCARYAAIPLEGCGLGTRPGPTVIRGAGPDLSLDTATGEWLRTAPGPQTGSTGDMFSLVRTPVPPRIVLHAGNVLRATEIHKWGHDTATVRWHPLEDGAARLAVTHFKTWGPVYDDALSRLGDTRGPLLLMLPTDLAAALRQELDSCDWMRVGWEAVADSTLLALLQRDPWSPPSHLRDTCRLCGECDTVCSAAWTGANRCAWCAQVAACSWPEPLTGPRRRTEEEALHRRIEGAHAPSHERAGPTGAALLWIHVHLRDPTYAAHLSHVFAP